MIIKDFKTHFYISIIVIYKDIVNLLR